MVPKWDAAHTALLWMQGTYASAQSYATAIVGTITGPRGKTPQAPGHSTAATISSSGSGSILAPRVLSENDLGELAGGHLSMSDGATSPQ